MGDVTGLTPLLKAIGDLSPTVISILVLLALGVQMFRAQVSKNRLEVILAENERRRMELEEASRVRQAEADEAERKRRDEAERLAIRNHELLANTQTAITESLRDQTEATRARTREAQTMNATLANLGEVTGANSKVVETLGKNLIALNDEVRRAIMAGEDGIVQIKNHTDAAIEPIIRKIGELPVKETMEELLSKIIARLDAIEADLSQVKQAILKPEEPKQTQEGNSGSHSQSG